MRALLDGGWRPTPFHQFVLKIVSRCDLACEHCYVYEMRDQSWRGRPRRMPREVLDRTAVRIAEHVQAHDLASVTLILHGGEPLLAGTGLLGDAVRVTRDAVRRAAGPGPGGRDRVRAVVQTNAVRLGERELELFDALDVRVGVSLDGTAAAHDRRRRHADGRGSHAEVHAALGQLTADRYRHLFAGLLCTVDLRNDPVETYEALLRYGPPTIDLLLPHANWSEPPAGRDAPERPRMATGWPQCSIAGTGRRGESPCAALRGDTSPPAGRDVHQRGDRAFPGRRGRGRDRWGHRTVRQPQIRIPRRPRNGTARVR